MKTLTRFAKRIIYLFDGDAAGQKAAERALGFIEQSSADLRCVVLPDGMDPMEFITARGGDALRALLEDAEPLMDFVFRKLGERCDTSTPGGRAAALDDACRLIYPLRSSFLIDTYFMQIADLLGLDVDAVRTASRRVFKQVQEEEAAQLRREQQRSLARGAKRSEPDEPVVPPYEDAEAAPYDYVPLDAYEDGGASGAVSPIDGVAAQANPDELLTNAERRALAGERELLTLLTSSPDVFRPFAERITAIDWVDPRHETIAWAVLATPEGTSPSDAMMAARAVCPEAAELVSSGTILSTSTHSVEANIGFLIDTLELYTVRRRLRSIQARLRQDRSLSHDERRELTIQATRDAARQRELQNAVEGIADPFREA